VQFLAVADMHPARRMADGGEPARSPPGRLRFRRPRDRTCGHDICRRVLG
jgi:hypothetical protein